MLERAEDSTGEEPALSGGHVPGASLELVSAQVPPDRYTGIEGYVYGRGKFLPGAQVSWRISRDAIHMPPSWTGGFLDECVQYGPEADLTSENPFRPEGSYPVRLGGGFAQFETAIVRSFATEPGTEYELTFESRFLQGNNNVTPHLESEGIYLPDTAGEYGIDLTGQESDPKAPTIAYQNVLDGPNNLWRRFRTRFKAEGARTSLWLRAAQQQPDVCLVWFDGIAVRPVEKQGGFDLLGAPPKSEGQEKGFLGTVTTTGRGYYRIEGLQPGEYDVLATYPGLGSAETLRIRVQRGEVTALNLNLYGGETISGVAQEANTGRPVPGALVTASLLPEDAERVTASGIVKTRTAQTSDSGRFQFDDLLPQVHYALGVEAAGFLAPPRHTTVPGLGAVTLFLHREGGVTGTVVRKGSGIPVPSAFVRILEGCSLPSDSRTQKEARQLFGEEASIDAYRRVAIVETDENGHFAAAALEPGTYCVIAEREGCLSSYTDRGLEWITIESPADTAHVRLELDAGGTLRGRAVEQDTKKPVAGLCVTFRLKLPVDVTRVLRQGIKSPESNSDLDLEKLRQTFYEMRSLTGMFHRDWSIREATPPLNVRFSVRTDSRGRFEKEGIGLGLWRAQIYSEDYRLKGQPQVFISPPKIAQVTLEVERVPTIGGIVVDSEDCPVTGAKIWWRRMMRDNGGAYTPHLPWYGLGWSDEEGRFVLRIPRAERAYDLMASLEDGDMGVFENARVGQEDVKIVLERAGSIEGAVFLSTGRPLVGAKAIAAGEDPWGESWSREDRTDAHGGFRILHLFPGTYTLHFAPWGADVIARYGPIEVPKGESLMGVVVNIGENTATPISSPQS